MSLFDEMTEGFILYNKVRVSDGEGGFVTTWAEGAEFDAAITLDNSMTARRAEADGVLNVYTVVFSRNVELDKFDVFKRKRDNKVFRITSDPTDMVTPRSAGLDMRSCSAQEWRLTT